MAVSLLSAQKYFLDSFPLQLSEYPRSLGNPRGTFGAQCFKGSGTTVGQVLGLGPCISQTVTLTRSCSLGPEVHISKCTESSGIRTGHPLHLHSGRLFPALP